MIPDTRTLDSDTLGAVAALGVRVPGYPRKSLVPGVVHLGLGAFHRAHQALVFDTLLQNGHGQWGIHGIAMRSNMLADALADADITLRPSSSTSEKSVAVLPGKG